jgi:hypothetical protein
MASASSQYVADAAMGGRTRPPSHLLRIVLRRAVARVGHVAASDRGGRNELHDDCTRLLAVIRALHCNEERLFAGSFYGSDGIRTRDLRRDRPVMALAR